MVDGFIRFLSRDCILIKGEEEFQFYHLNVTDRVCSCKSFIHRGNCKHISKYAEFKYQVPLVWEELPGSYTDGVYHFVLQNIGGERLNVYFNRYGYRRSLQSEDYYPSIEPLLKSRAISSCN